MALLRYRIIDTDGSEVGLVDLDADDVAEDAVVALPDGGSGTVVEIYDDEDGREGGVAATLVVESN